MFNLVHYCVSDIVQSGCHYKNKPQLESQNETEGFCIILKGYFHDNDHLTLHYHAYCMTT